MPVSKVCEKCGTGFTVPPRRSEEVRFCSRACKTAAGRITLHCAACGKLFERVSSDQRGQAAYCSRECYHAGQQGRPKQLPDSRPRYVKTCEVCAAEFRVTKTRSETARFCSRVCQKLSATFAKECSERQQGEKSHRWTGGKYKDHAGYIRQKAKRLGVETVAWEHRAVILEAMLAQAPHHPFIDRAGAKPRLRSDIDVHHIDRDRAHNDLSNLLAVTRQAHALIHLTNRKPEPWECWPPNPDKW